MTPLRVPERADRDYDVVALGEAMVELNATRGNDGMFVRGYGGDTSNMAIAVARVGRASPMPLRVAYVTRVGDDAFGAALLALWRSEGVDVRGVEVDAEAPTGVYFVTHGAAGHEFSYLRRGSAASAMSPGTLPRGMLTSTRLLHVSGISAAISPSACDAVLEAVDVARQAGALISFDPNLRLKLWPLPRARAVVREILRATDVFLPGLEEMRTISGLDVPAAIVEWSHGHGPAVVALKCGAEGSWCSTGQTPVHVPVFDVEAIDATGAGDCFDGTFCARLLAGDDPLQAARYANAAAALATTGYGAVAPLPDHASVRALLASLS